MQLSLIVPYHNEEINLVLLYQRILQTFDKIHKELDFENFEIIFIDDGSTDQSTQLLIKTIHETNKIYQKQYDFNVIVKIYQFKYNEGQSAALSLGFSKASGKYIATIDSDLQNDPEDLVKLLKTITTQNQVEIVSGYRVQRKETTRAKISSIGNLLIRIISGYQVKDVGCSLKVYKNYTIKDTRLPPGYHRFLPIIAKADKKSILNIPVNHSKRFYGKSHYNYSRIFWLLKNILILPIIKGGDIDKINARINILKLGAYISLLFIPLSILYHQIIFLIILSVILHVSLIKAQNYIKYRQVFDSIPYQKILELQISKNSSGGRSEYDQDFDNTNSIPTNFIDGICSGSKHNSYQ
ncbi:MAG: glycosyltransferase [bacterium]